MFAAAKWVLVSALSALALQAALPPLIDRDAFFGEIQISGAQLSPDGQYVSFLKPYKGERNVWVKKASEPFSAAKPVTAETKRPVVAYFWSRDSKYVLYAEDQAGDENYNVFAVDPAGAPDATRGAPPVRNLTTAVGARAIIYALPKNEPDVMYIGLNDRDKAWHDLYKITISTGQRTLVRRNTDRVAAWIFDHQGKLRMAERTDDAGNTEILRSDADKLVPIYTCSVLESCGVHAFDQNDRELYISTNKGDTDLVRLEMLDPATGHTTLVESDPLKRVDLAYPMFSERTNKLIGTAYEDDRVRRYWRDPVYEAEQKFLRAHLPGLEFDGVSTTADESKVLIAAHSDVEPSEVYLFDKKAKTLTLQYRVREELPREALCHEHVVHYPSSDGLEIPAYLTLPKGIAPKDLPVIVFPHGGPWARDSWGYSTMAQFLANRGYAVLSPNFRGSTGYGKKFLNAGNGEWGRKMQDDITWGVKYLVAKGIADPKRIGIAGGSYGGYATLAGVAFTPDLYAAAVDIVGPSNLVTLLGSIPPYWEAARKVMYTRMADPNSPDGKKLLEAESPLFSADKIRTPLLVVQGANDPRVNKREADQIVIALRDRGMQVQYLVAPDEGHGFARPVNNLAMTIAMEKFFAEHLNGRAQDGGSPESIARLKEITVDPKSVVLAAKVDVAKMNDPVPTHFPVDGSSKYKVTIAVNGQTIPVQAQSDWKATVTAFSVTDTAQTPMGAITDSATLDSKTLQPIERHVKQGAISIDFQFSPTKVTGTMTMGGTTKPVDITLQKPVYADGAGNAGAIAALPLADGYQTTFTNIDAMKMQPILKVLRVVGSEKVTAQGANVDAYKVQLENADGSPGQMTLWVTKQDPKVVKYTAVLPEMGGAQLTGELQ